MNEPITIRETPNQRYACTTTGRCDPKTEQRIAVMRLRELARIRPIDEPDPVVICRSATAQELADFDARTLQQRRRAA